MLEIPQEVQELFKQDSISKNFRVHFPDGEFRDLVNKDFVSESVIFTEAVSSDGVIKFGVAESPSIEFLSYFNEDLTDILIYCEIEIDITSLDTEIIQEIGVNSEDVPFTYYPVPYGYFIVDSSVFNDDGTIRTVAYSVRLTENLLQRLYHEDINKLLKVKLMWGATWLRLPWIEASSINTGVPGDNACVKVSKFELLKSVCPTIERFLPTRLLHSYDVNSEIFNYANTLPFSRYSSSELHYAENPVLKSFYIRYKDSSDNSHMGYVFVKGKKIVFDDDTSDFYTHNSYGVPISNLTNSPTYNYSEDIQSSKHMEKLPYTLSSEHMYEISWKNDIPFPTVDDFADDVKGLYWAIYNDIALMISPCITFKDISTWPTAGISEDTTDPDSTVVPMVDHLKQPNLLFPTAVMELEIGMNASPGGTTSTFFHRYPTVHEDVYNYLGYSLSMNTTSDIFVNELARQNIINLTPEVSEDGTNTLTIFPNLFQFDESSVDDPTYIMSRYKEALANKCSFDSWSNNRPRHIEIGIPTEIVLMEYPEASAPVNSMFSILPSSETPRVSYSYQTVQINNYRDLLLKQYEYDKSGYYSIPVTQRAANPSPMHYWGEACTAGFTVPVGMIDYDTLPFSKEYVGPDPLYYSKDFPGGASESRVILGLKGYNCSPEIIPSSVSTLTDFAEINALLFKASRDEYLSWKFMPMDADKLAIYPEDTLYPNDRLFPKDLSFMVSRSLWRKLHNSPSAKHPYNKITCTINDVYYESVIIDVYDESEYKQYDLSKNSFLLCGLVDIQETLDYLASILRASRYCELQMTMRGLPYCESGDMLKVSTKDNFVTTINSRQRIKGIQSLIAEIENH